MDKAYESFERYISYILIIVASIFVCYQVVDLVYHFVMRMVHSIGDKQFEVEEPGKPVAGLFFNILLLLEIIQTVKVFAEDHSVKLRIILIVGLIAVTRKILMMDIDEHHATDEFAIAALILALSAGYFLITRSERFDTDKK